MESNDIAELKDLYQRAFRILRRHDRNTMAIVGDMGELLIHEKLTELGVQHIWKGKGSRVDFELDNGEGVEVRASVPRHDWKKDILNHGWTVKKRDKPLWFSYLICVEFDKNLNNPRFLIFTKEEAERADNVDSDTHYGKTIETNLVIPVDPNEVGKVRDVIGQFALEVTTNPVDYENKWEKLTE